MSLPSVLVLAGGPDLERPISLASGAAVAAALREAGHAVEYREIERLDGQALAGMPGDVVFPVLHGLWGEGGPLQTLLEDGGRPYVGCGPAAARLAMDKLATKLLAAGAGVPTLPAGVVVPGDPACCLPLPVVVKPVHEGSSIGLMMCRDVDAWDEAARIVGADRTPGRVYMAESLVTGRELAVGLVGDGGGGFLDLPLIEIVPSGGVYDYEAKYTRGDTRYVVGPDLPPGLARRVRDAAIAVARAVGLRHLGRVDFLVDADGGPWMLEVNTMPGFTATSLLPKAAAAAGRPMPELASGIVGLAASGERIGAGPGVRSGHASRAGWAGMEGE